MNTHNRSFFPAEKKVFFSGNKNYASFMDKLCTDLRFVPLEMTVHAVERRKKNATGSNGVGGTCTNCILAHFTASLARGQTLFVSLLHATCKREWIYSSVFSFAREYCVADSCLLSTLFMVFATVH